jgi:hypothetical protein
MAHMHTDNAPAVLIVFDNAPAVLIVFGSCCCCCRRRCPRTVLIELQSLLD